MQGTNGNRLCAYLKIEYLPLNIGQSVSIIIYVLNFQKYCNDNDDLPVYFYNILLQSTEDERKICSFSDKEASQQNDFWGGTN